jgi:RNA polymerase sigma-70 factor, ECF subfamily
VNGTGTDGAARATPADVAPVLANGVARRSGWRGRATAVASVVYSGSDIDARVRDLIARSELDTAATEILRSFGTNVRRYLRSVLRDEADAADAYACFAEKVWRGLSSYRGTAPVRVWTYRVAHNCAVDARKQARRVRERRLTTTETQALAEPARRTADSMERHRGELDALRERLTEQERALLFLRVDQELSWVEIARVLSGDGRKLDPTTVMKRFGRLSARLERMARQRGLVD